MTTQIGRSHAASEEHAEVRCLVCGSAERQRDIVQCGFCDAHFHLGRADNSSCGDVVATARACGVTLRCFPCRDAGRGF